MYSLDRPEVVMVFASIAPSALSGADLPVAVLLDSPFNDPVVSRAAVAALLGAGIGVGAMREISARESSSTVIEADGDAATRSPRCLTARSDRSRPRNGRPSRRA